MTFEPALLASSALLLLVFAVARTDNPTSKNPLGHPVRRGILDMIRRMPGARLNLIWRAFSTNRGTAQYHLLVLERSGAVKAVRQGQATRYFPSELGAGELPGLAFLMQGRVLEVARTILNEPGISQHRLTHLLPISRKVFRDYADRLAELDLLTEVRDARLKRYFPTPRLTEMLHRLDPDAADPLGADDEWPAR